MRNLKGLKRGEWIDRTGEIYGRLTILGDAEPYRGAKRLLRRVRCRCECGNECIIYLSQLKPWRVSSCGCYQSDKAKTHGMSKTRTYRIWWGMLNRGLGNLSQKNYKDKGIGVCERWRVFENFLEDMGERPFPKATIDF